jgi:hypothetical protein
VKWRTAWSGPVCHMATKRSSRWKDEQTADTWLPAQTRDSSCCIYTLYFTCTKMTTLCSNHAAALSLVTNTGCLGNSSSERWHSGVEMRVTHHTSRSAYHSMICQCIVCPTEGLTHFTNSRHPPIKRLEGSHFGRKQLPVHEPRCRKAVFCLGLTI